ncbi:MAG TPA: hypothetical protein VF182_14005, partial [Candidatus Binatia bacterium]
PIIGFANNVRHEKTRNVRQLNIFIVFLTERDCAPVRIFHGHLYVNLRAEQLWVNHEEPMRRGFGAGMGY